MAALERIRLFIGTRVPANVVTLVRSTADQHLAHPFWRVAPEQQWHVTALFIGERPTKDLPGIQAAVERIVVDTPVIRLENGALRTMPEDGPTMLWVRFDPHAELTRLHLRLAQALFMPPSQHVPYWPHITLARSRGKADVLQKPPTVLHEFPLRELTLFRSEPGPHGTIHTPLITWPLARTGPTAPEVAG
jgi:2'-5' RNA ligase